MSKKPSKVNEPRAPYAAKKPAPGKPSGQSGVEGPEFRRIADKIFSERKELLHKLAQ